MTAPGCPPDVLRNIQATTFVQPGQLPCHRKVAVLEMPPNEKFSAIRKGLLEFLILKIVAAGKVYVADILNRLSDTEFATQEGTLYPLLSKMRRDGLVDYEWQESDAGPPRRVLPAHREGHGAARRAHRLLETPERHDCAVWTVGLCRK